MKKITLCFLFAVFLLSFYVFAHGVNLFCYLEGDTLHGEGYFSGGSPAKNSRVEIYDIETNKLVTITTTDNEGKFSLILKEIKNLKIILLAGMGHKAEYILNPSRDMAPEASGSGQRQAVFKTANQEGVGTGKADTQGNIYGYQPDYRKIEEIVEKKTKPLHEELIKLEKMYSRPNFSAIVGGIGWIVGIFSLLYLLKKKNAS